jgi:ribosomal protein L4
METANAQKDYEQAQENVKNQQSNWELAQQNYEQVILAYKSGITPFVDVVSVDELKHYAKDGGKSAAEIAKITKPEVTYSFLATGVYIRK